MTFDRWDVIVVVVDVVAVAAAIAYLRIRQAVIRRRWPEAGADRTWCCPQCPSAFTNPRARQLHVQFHHAEVDSSTGAIGPDTGWM